MITRKHFAALMGFPFVAAWIGFSFGAAILCLVSAVLFQLKIASDIVTITYAALMGAVAPGMALEFGLGGRDVASCMLEDAYRRGQDEPGRLRGRAAAQRAASAETARMPTGPGRSPTAT
jgi:hypothetical protein